MASLTNTSSEGYGAAMFTAADGYHTIELQVDPMGFRLYVSNDRAYRARRGQWLGSEAVAIAAGVCNGETPHAILADWVEENAPASLDRDFKAGAWLRASN